jgi:hypothetical protein
MKRLLEEVGARLVYALVWLYTRIFGTPGGRR